MKTGAADLPLHYGKAPMWLFQRTKKLAREIVIFIVDQFFKDPARYSFAHGGKDGYPYPVNRDNYDKSVEILKTAINQAHVDRSDKIAAIKRLALLR